VEDPVFVFVTHNTQTERNKCTKIFRAYAGRAINVALSAGDHGEADFHPRRFAVNFAVSHFIVFHPRVLLEKKQPPPRRPSIDLTRPTKSFNENNAVGRWVGFLP
jgi:hypothetical protein